MKQVWRAGDAPATMTLELWRLSTSEQKLAWVRASMQGVATCHVGIIDREIAVKGATHDRPLRRFFLRWEDRTIKRGDNRAYQLARLGRDYPDILARYERGEFKSVRAAAKAAGILKERQRSGSGSPPFERQGEITPPCGEPSAAWRRRPSSRTPAFSHLSIIRRTVRS